MEPPARKLVHCLQHNNQHSVSASDRLAFSTLSVSLLSSVQQNQLQAASDAEETSLIKASKWAVWRLPSVVLGIEQEVSTDDGDAHSHYDHDEEHEHHKPVDVVDLVGPEGGEDEVPVNRERDW